MGPGRVADTGWGIKWTQGTRHASALILCADSGGSEPPTKDADAPGTDGGVGTSYLSNVPREGIGTWI